jgi:outer membrane protein OmpA-like peptidoglycan-associated protein
MKKPSKSQKLYQKAYHYYGLGQYDKSLEQVHLSLDKDSLNMPSLRLLSDIYNLQGLFEKEKTVYRRILRIDSTDMRAHMNLGDIHLKTGNFSRAERKFRYLSRAPWLPERYLPLVVKQLEKAKVAFNIVSEPKDFGMERLKGPVNTGDDEYWPTLTPDGRHLFFTQTNVGQSIYPGQQWREENIYAAAWIDTVWGDPIRLPKQINTNENEGAQCITQDGNTMFMTVCMTTVGTQGDCNLYTSHWKNGKWSTRRKLPLPVNTPYKETQPSVSYDGKTLFFSSDRPGGKGGMDLWATRMNQDSLWANPINLGDLVNTSANEESPFIHPDNNTLYFTSNGHPGLGKGDFFMYKLSEGVAPVNLGFPLNNHEMQLGIYVDLEGDYGYYASVDPALHSGLDLYRFKIPDEVAPNPLKIIKGELRDAITAEPIGHGVITVYNLARNQQVVRYTSPPDGSFKFGLPAHTQFAILADADGYLPHSIHSNANEVSKDSTLTIYLFPLGENGVFSLRNIFFDFDSSRLEPASMPEIAYLADFLTKYPHVAIEIGGHTDNRGSEAYNLALSERRAAAVLDELEKAMGSNLEHRVSVKGYGDRQPVANNETEEGRKENRRTEIKIIRIN